jgi:multidrug efflux pump
VIVSNYAIKFRAAVFVLIAVMVILGSISYVQLPREGPPDITIPNVFVTAMYEGTAPEEMEKLVTIPLERQLSDIEGVKKVSSSTMEGLCFINIEFAAGEDISDARQMAKDKIDLARLDLPPDLDEPIVDAFSLSADIPIYILTLSGDEDLSRLKLLADDLRDELELVPGIKSVEIAGVREREIRVELDPARLAGYGLPPTMIMGRIARENATVSAGNIETLDSKLQVRILGEFETAQEVEDLLVTTVHGQPVFLRDVAEVRDTYKDLSSISRLNEQTCVTMSIKKRSGENTVGVIRDAQEVIADFAVPPGIELTPVMDQRDYIDMMVSELENNIVTGFLLVIVVLCAFMGFRNSLFVAIAIPLSMLITFSILWLSGITLNMIVLFSLVLAVGMLVDNAIVIVENIYRNRSLGMTAIDAARKGTAEVAWPVITSTVTTCAAFSPLLFWPDIMGQFMGYLPRTLIIVLSSSLFVALVVNPALCSALIGMRRKPLRQREEQPHRFVLGYERFLRGALSHRTPVIVISVLFLFTTVLLYAAFDRGVELFPEVPPRFVQIHVLFPQGTPIEKTDAALMDIEKKLRDYKDIKFYQATAGGGSAISLFGGGAGGTHIGTIHVEFVKAAERTTNTTELVNTIRDAVGTIPGAQITVEKEKEGPPTGPPVGIEVSGDDFDRLSELSRNIMKEIETVPGLVDLRDDFEEALPELQFHVDRDRAALLGLDTQTIGFFLRTAIYGMESSKLRADEDEYDITLRLPRDDRDTVDLLNQVMVPVGNGWSVPLSSLGTIEYGAGRGVISRHDRKRVITIAGNAKERGADKVLKDVRTRLEGYELPRGYEIAYTGEDEEIKESGAFLGRAFVFAVMLIWVVLVLQFNSVDRPGIIMMSIVLSLIGVMLGLLICGMRFGVIMTGVGVISLVGIVVNNAIVLVDCILQREREGMSTTEAIVAAGKMRLRPVLLTAITTVLGLIPMAAGYSLEIHHFPPTITAGAETSAWWKPMAVAVIFGLTAATVLTLVLVPTMYSMSNALSHRVMELFRRRNGGCTMQDA